MRRIILMAFLCLTLLLPAAAALAHEGETHAAFAQTVAAGPYRLTAEYGEWPPAARRVTRYVLVPEGGIAGKEGTYRFVPGPGVKGAAHGGRLEPYPGIADAWLINHPGLPGEGHWTLEFTVVGPEGAHSGSTPPFRVGPPPDVPMWVGWVLGLTPMYGLVWFQVRECRRVRRAIREDQGARL